MKHLYFIGTFGWLEFKNIKLSRKIFSPRAVYLNHGTILKVGEKVGGGGGGLQHILGSG